MYLFTGVGAGELTCVFCFLFVVVVVVLFSSSHPTYTTDAEYSPSLREHNIHF